MPRKCVPPTYESYAPVGGVYKRVKDLTQEERIEFIARMEERASIAVQAICDSGKYEIVEEYY